MALLSKSQRDQCAALTVASGYAHLTWYVSSFYLTRLDPRNQLDEPVQSADPSTIINLDKIALADLSRGTAKYRHLDHSGRQMPQEFPTTEVFERSMDS